MDPGDPQGLIQKSTSTIRSPGAVSGAHAPGYRNAKEHAVAIIHQAELQPGKLELIAEWLPYQPWAQLGEDTSLVKVGSYRFDDPAGEVGAEVLLVRMVPNGWRAVLAEAAGEESLPLLQIPLSYRDAPLDGAENSLLGTMQHSVLGKRWVYDGAADPVFVAEAVRAIVESGESVPFMVETETGPQETTQEVVRAWGTGAPEPYGPELRGPAADAEARGLPVVQELEGLSISRLGDYTLALERSPGGSRGTALDTPAGQLLVQLPVVQGKPARTVVAARLID